MPSPPKFPPAPLPPILSPLSSLPRQRLSSPVLLLLEFQINAIGQTGDCVGQTPYAHLYQAIFFFLIHPCIFTLRCFGELPLCAKRRALYLHSPVWNPHNYPSLQQSDPRLGEPGWGAWGGGAGPTPASQIITLAQVGSPICGTCGWRGEQWVWSCTAAGQTNAPGRRPCRAARKAGAMEGTPSYHTRAAASGAACSGYA